MRFFPLVVPALLMLTTSCGDESPPAGTTTVASTPPRSKAKDVDAGADDEASAESEYVYNPIGKRDPFRTFIAMAEEEEIRSPTPLQRYEIDQYQLTGIVWGIERPRALMEDPEGVGHVVEQGTYIGRNWGKITQITSEKIVVTEEYLTPDGSLVVNLIEIKLNTPGEE